MISPTELHALEKRLLSNKFMVDTKQHENIRYCVSHIILKAIALSKDPRADKTRVKDLFDLASELLAFTEVETEIEDNRLRDLIDAMIDGEDVSVNIRKASSEVKALVASLDAKMTHRTSLLQESLDAISNNVDSYNSTIQPGYSRKVTLKVVIFIIALGCSLLFALIAGSVIIAAYLNYLSQPDPYQKNSLLMDKHIKDYVFYTKPAKSSISSD